MDERPLISFIIPAFNEELLLPRTLQALRTAGESCGRSYEIVVADDASTDRTAEVSRAHGALVTTHESRQIAASRNAGAAAASGDYLVFVDADTIVPPETVEATIHALTPRTEGGLGGVGGGCRIEFDGNVPRYARALMPGMMVLYRLFRLAAGCYIFCTREAFDATGGFNERVYAGEESFMSKAIARHGRFVVLDEVVITSGRKLRTYSPRELFGELLMVPFRLGARSDLWYGTRRDDPDGIPGVSHRSESVDGG